MQYAGYAETVLHRAVCGLLFAVAIAAAVPFNANGSAVDAKLVRYSDFGAVGDGETDDFDAIIAAHAFANDKNLPVKADDDAEYYIGGGKRTAIIETDTDFGAARFLIDDSVVPVHERNSPVFSVRSKLRPITLENLSELRVGQSNIGCKLKRNSLLLIENDRVRRFIRHGNNSNSGAPQTDVVIVDEDGNVDSSTPIAWDFEHISSCRAYPLDRKTLSLSGGRFTTIANNADVAGYTSYGRNIEIRRSNVVVDGLRHFVTAEGEHGAPYGGFISIRRCADVRVENSVLSGHKTYYSNDGVPMGSYDILANRAVNVSFVNVTQANEIDDRSLWGIMGSNYCRNLLYKNCVLSRFDAHQGVFNASILDSTLRIISIIGKGVFRIEDSEVRGRSFIKLRSDYGSTWQGEFLIRNCVWIPSRPGSALIDGRNRGRHDFGYDCSMPRIIQVQNLYVDDSKWDSERINLKLFGNFNPALKDEDYQQKHPYKTSELLILKNAKTASGKALSVSDNDFMFRRVEIRD